MSRLWCNNCHFRQVAVVTVSELAGALALSTGSGGTGLEFDNQLNIGFITHCAADTTHALIISAGMGAGLSIKLHLAGPLNQFSPVSRFH